MKEKMLIQQLRNLFLLEDEEGKIILEGNYSVLAEEKAIRAMSSFNNKYLLKEFNPFNSVMYCNYLYWISRLLYIDGYGVIADKVYYLNKTLNSVDLFYGIELPEEWSCEHPLGAVLGRAKYGNHFFFYQGCTVGGNYHKGILSYPEIGDNVLMYSNSKILGNSIIGDNVVISANAYIKDEVIPENSIVFGQSPNIVIKERR